MQIEHMKSFLEKLNKIELKKITNICQWGMKTYFDLSCFPKNISGCLYFLFINSLYFDQFHRTQNLSLCFSNKCIMISESLDICAGKQDKIQRKNATCFAV